MSKAWLAAGAATLAAAILVAVNLPGSDDNGEPKQPRPSDVVLQFGDLDVSEELLNRHVDFVRSVDPNQSPSHIRKVWLGDWILRRHAVRKLVPATTIAAAEKKAENLATAVRQLGGRVSNLRELGKPYDLQDSGVYHPPFTLALDVAKEVFSVEKGTATGAVHSAFSSVVAAVVDEKTQGGVRKRRIVSVAFGYTGEMPQSRISDGVKALENGPVWVHPYYRDEFGLRYRDLRPEPLR